MRKENPLMPFSVKASIDDHTLTADADTRRRLSQKRWNGMSPKD
jgi:hypothetical protein